MKRILFCGLLLFAVLSVVNAQQKKEEHRELNGRLVDFVTNDPLPDSTKVCLMSKDSVFITDGGVYNVFDGTRRVTYFFVDVNKPGDYILQFTNPRYYTEYKPVSVRFFKREKSISLGVIPMRLRTLRNEYELRDVEVRGTLLKFYFSNDTLVYNAAPFITQPGFVLNDILRKMPGIEIHDNGDIYSNGKKVDALLLNGKDFFNRDRKTLLENLPAYTVKQVKLYDKTKDAQSLIRREREFEGFVMDVRLKPEYEHSSIANIDMGYGTEDRYYAKAVGLKFSSVHKLSVYGFANNLNRTEMPAGNGDSHFVTTANGDYVIDRAGFSYNFDNPRGLFATEGDLDVSYIDGYSEIKNSKRNFFNTGDIFSRSINKSNQYKFALSSNHKLGFFENTSYGFTLIPSLKYSTSHENMLMANASFETDTDSLWHEAWLDSLMSDEPTGVMALYGINRERMRQKTDRESLELTMGLEKNIDIPHTEDELRLSGSFRFSSDKDNNYRQRNIEYLRTQSGQFLNEYARNKTFNREWKGNAVYVLKLNDSSFFNFDYHYNFLSLDNDNPIYSLHRLAGWDHAGGNKIGLLPSELGMLDILDKNSHAYWQKNNEHTVNLKYNLGFQAGNNGTANINADIPMKFHRRRMNYTSPDCDKAVERSMVLPNLNINISYNYSNNEKRTVRFWGLEYSLDHEMPSLYNLLDITNDNNPLYVTHGNPGLKNMRKHHLFTQFFYQSPMRNVHRLNMTFDRTDNQISVAQVFNRETGVTHATPLNVDGNYSYDMKFVNNVYADKSRRMQLTNTLQLAGNRSVDQIVTDGEERTGKSTVRNFYINDMAGFNYKSKSTRLMLKGQVFFQYTRSTGDRPNFVTQNYYNYGGILNACMELPHNFRLETDWTFLARRGLSYSEMNTTESLWNAAVTKTVNDKLSFKLEAYDILNQRKLVVRRVNAQCAEEMYYNPMRSYVILHCVIRLSSRHDKHHAAHEHIEPF